MQTLIVDDEPAIRRELVGLLSPFGPCDVAPDGEAGIAAVRSQLSSGSRYDLICLDVTMPGTNGFASLKEIRRLEGEHLTSQTRASRVLMVTGLGQNEVWVRARSEGCSGYLTKPIHGIFLLNLLVSLGLVRRGLARPRAEPDGAALLHELEARLLGQRGGDPASERETIHAFIAAVECALGWMGPALEGEHFDVVARHADDLAQAAARVGSRSLTELCGEVGQASAALDRGGCRTSLIALERAAEALRSAFVL